MSDTPSPPTARELFDAIDRKAAEIYGSARSDWLLKFCQEVVHVCARGRETLRQRDEARSLVSAYFAYHTEDGSEECPCSVCEKARRHFASILREKP